MSNQANPERISHIDGLIPQDWTTLSGAIQVQGDYLYFIGGACNDDTFICGAGLTIFNVSDPTRPTRTGSYSTGYAPIGIQVVAQRIYLLSVDWLEILDVNSPNTFISYGSYVAPYPYVTAMKIVGNHAYVLGRNAQAYIQQSNRLQILNIDSPRSPQLLGSYPANGNAIDVAGQFAYVASNGLVVLDISDPISPTLRSTFSMSEGLNTVQAIDQVAYLLSSGQLDIVDISDAAAPTLRGSYAPANTSYYEGMRVEGNLAYLTGVAGMDILDVTNPASPILRGAYTSAYPDIIHVGQVIGNLVYLAAGEYGPGVDLLDVSDPSRPTLQGRYRYRTQNSGVDVWSDGKLVYLADTGGIRILDATDPAHPLPRGSVDTIGRPTQLQVVGDLVYVADTAGGLLILHVHPERFAPVVFLPIV